MNHFINTFNDRLEEVMNKEFLIDNEINQIEKFISNDEPFQEINIEPAYMKQNNSVFNLNEMGNPIFFNSIFNQYLLCGEYESILEDELVEGNRIKEDESIMFIINEAVLFKDYYTWLKELDSENLKQVISTKSQLSLKESILVLHYLGLDFTKYNQTALSDILSSLLGKSQSNTRTAIGLLLSAKKERDIKTNENLYKMVQVFDNKEFNGVRAIIKDELKEFGVTD